MNSKDSEFLENLKRSIQALPPDQLITLETEGFDALPAWFLGPKAENAKLITDLIQAALDNQIKWRTSKVYPRDPPFITDEMRTSAAYIRGEAHLKKRSASS